MGRRSRRQFGFRRQPSTPLEYTEVLELVGAVHLGEVPPDALQSAEVQQVLRNFERELVAVSRSLSSEAGGGASRRRESSAGCRCGAGPVDAGDSVNAPDGGGVPPADIPPRVDHPAGRAILRPGGVHAAGRSCCGRSGGGECLPGFVMGHGGMSLSGRRLSRSFDDGGVVASLDEVREEEGAWAPPGWRWVCLLDGGRSLVRAPVRECPRTVWFPGSEPCHCHSSETIQGCMAEEDAHVGRYLSHWSELPRGWVVVLGPTGRSRVVPAAWEATPWSDE